MADVQPERRRRSRFGPEPLPASALRTHCVSVRLAPDELARLDTERGPYRRGEWLRMAWQRALPPAPPPELNRQAWVEASRIAANLNQLVLALRNAGHDKAAGLADLAYHELAAFRAALVGAAQASAFAAADDEEGDE